MNASLLPRCADCGSQKGPFKPTGGRAEDGAQVLVCSTGCAAHVPPLALAAKRVIEAAWMHGTAYDLASQAAFALEAACLLQSPEKAAELTRLHTDLDGARLSLWEEEQANRRARLAATLARKRAAELREALVDTTHALTELRSRFAELKATAGDGMVRPVDEDPIAYALVETPALLARQSEDAHTSPLHHTYRLGRDLEARP